MKRTILSVLLVGTLMLPAWGAPLFPDVPDAHWAKDAVAALAAKGLVEGYPDGTFKGDRAASRWEVAMIVARLLAKMEQAHATFATKAELEELRKLTAALREELDALGVRVTNLEENLNRIDSRVTELERITFYGYVDTRFVAQSFSNSGNGDNDSNRNGGGLASAPGVPFMNYNTAVGSAVGATRRPQLHGAFPVVDYKRGKALTNGTGFSMRGVLGLNIRVSEEVDAGAEFSAYSSQGDRFIDGYWGVTAPWLQNPVTASAAGGAAAGTQSINHVPYTRLTLDNFWVQHKPSKTKVILGEILTSRFDSLVYAGQVNLGVHGPRRWAGFGFDVTGQADFEDKTALKWEVLGTRFGDGNAFLGTDYQHYAWGANVAYEFAEGDGQVKLNFARMLEEAPPGGLNLLGLDGPGGGTTGMNVTYGASTGWTVRQWVNPPGYFAAQRSQFEQNNTGAVGGILVPNTIDTRPIVGWNGAADNAVGFVPGGGGGNFGPQSQDNYGISARYKWKLGEEEGDPVLRLNGIYAHSDYKPSRNSAYSAGGDAAHLEFGASLLNDELDLSLEYLTVDPTYGPAAWFGNLLGARFPRTMNFTGVWHLHDFGQYPHNREGFGFAGKWKFDEKKGALWLKGRFLEQKETSLYDVRRLPGSLGAGTPNFTVVGFSPGWVDPIFYGYAHPNLYGPGTANSFTTTLAPLENPSGDEGFFQVGASYKWDDPGVRVKAVYEKRDFERPTTLTPGLGGSQNHVDLDTDYWNFDVAWDVDDRWTVFGGVDYTSASGHWDPAGIYNPYAISIGSSTFTNLDSDQFAPYLGFDFDLSKGTTWNMTFTHYDTTDKVAPQVRAGTALDTFGASAHPFSWDGWQISSQFMVKF